jgi:putative ABC transport system substrate-binding protein
MSLLKLSRIALSAFVSILLLSWVTNALADEAKPFRITMVVFRGCEEACEGFKSYWATRKIPVEIEVLDAKTDVKRLAEFVKQVKANKPDLLVTWGTTVSLQMLGTVDNVDPAKHVTDIPSLFMIASTPVGSKLVKSLNAPSRNVTGTLYIVPVATQLSTARLYMPFKRVGYISNSTEDNSKIVQQELELAQFDFNFDLVAVNVPLTAAGKPDASSLPDLIDELAKNKVDLLYFAPDTFLLLNRDVITKEAVKRKMPVLAVSEAIVRESDALFGVVNRYSTVGQLTASKAEMILVKKIEPKNIPIVAPPGFTLIVNMKIAKELQKYPPLRVVKIAETVH